MIFLNAIMLLGLVALAVPVAIHLLSRTRVREIDWGAMRFLVASLVARRRRLLIEEIILLVIRCLAVAFVALAMARPFLPNGAGFASLLVLPAFIFAAALAALAAAFWSRRDTRRKILRAFAALVAAAVVAALGERWLQQRRWFSAAAARDTVILIDASASMAFKVDGRTNFERAVEEARAIAELSRRGDSTAIILAGPIPHPLIAVPTADRREVLAALDRPELKPVGGSLGVLEALNAAAAALAEGHGALKRIVLITDAQDAGWDIQGEGRWKYVADALQNLSARPQFFCRRLAMPAAIRNVAVADIALSRAVVGLDRPVRIDVRVANSGSVPVQPAGIELLVDGASVLRQEFLKEIPPAAAEGIRFDHRFAQPGRHLLAARVICDDDLPADNTDHRAVEILERLPVLIVDGAPGERFFQGAASFIKLALTPKSDAAPAGPAAAAPAGAAAENYLIEPTVVRATALAGIADLSPYRVVILANVPRLPGAVTDRLEAFVRRGGGLLIAPGPRAEPEFYNAWRTPTGFPILPATLADRTVLPETPARFELKTFAHPALRLVGQDRYSDAGMALVKGFWRLAADAADPAVRIAATLDNGAPLLVERRLGRGYVLMTAIPFDRRDSNLPSLKCFLPLAHELVYYLAAPLLPDCNISPGAEMTYELSPRCVGLTVALPALKAYPANPNPPIQVATPSAGRVPAAIAPGPDSLVLRFAATREPGLYRFLVPPALATASNGAPAGVAIPFVVLGQGRETSASTLSEADLAQLEARVGMAVLGSREQLVAAFGGEVPGREAWKWLALAALFLAVAESAVTRWIAIQRRFNAAQVVTIQSPAESAVNLKHLAGGGRSPVKDAE